VEPLVDEDDKPAEDQKGEGQRAAHGPQRMTPPKRPMLPCACGPCSNRSCTARA
jgi:hypothetical protein